MKILSLLILTFLLSGCTIHQYIIEHEPRCIRQHLMADSDRHHWNYKEITTPHVSDCYTRCNPCYQPRQARKIYYYE